MKRWNIYFRNSRGGSIDLVAEVHRYFLAPVVDHTGNLAKQSHGREREERRGLDETWTHSNHPLRIESLSTN